MNKYYTVEYRKYLLRNIKKFKNNMFINIINVNMFINISF